jgi:hypothetical protein
MSITVGAVGPVTAVTTSPSSALPGVLVPIGTDTIGAELTALGSNPGTLILGPGTYDLSTTPTFTTKQGLKVLGPGTTIRWVGAAAGTMFKIGDGTTAPNRVNLDFGNCDIDANSLADVIFDGHSAQKCHIDNANIFNTRTSTIVLNLLADAANNGLTGNKNSTRCVYSGITAWDNIGKMVVLQGTSAVAGIVTNNRFMHLYASNVNSKFADLVQWCDTNKWFGMYAKLVASNAIGYDFGSADGTGVYNEWVVFDCDTFTGANTGRVAVRFRTNSKQNTLWLFNDPVAEGGTLVVQGVTLGVVVDSGVYSYDLRLMAPAGSSLNNAILGV